MTKSLPQRLCPAALCAVVLLSVRPAHADDKSGYNLFHPTPPELMRPLSTDRPDQTESAYTVDAGHIQIEMDLGNYIHDRDNGVTTEVLTVAPINFKVGLLNNVDIQLFLDTYIHERVKAAGSVQTADGIGDFQTRLKVNLWGNDGGVTALAVMPYVKWPTAHDSLGNGVVEGGVIIPLAINITERLGFGVMTQFDFLRNEADSDYHPDFINSLTFGADLTDRIGAYIEFFTVVSTEEDSGWQGQFDVGMTYSPTDNIQFDAGVNMGVTSNAPDWQPFVGATFRF